MKGAKRRENIICKWVNGLNLKYKILIIYNWLIRFLNK